ncbi:MAG: hypothetical protein C4339_04515 [Nitrososphaerota archaeon]
MQLLHISDTHLGRAQFNLEEREEDLYESLGEAVEAAIREHVKCVIHAGDIFDSPRPGGRPLLRLLEELRRLKERGISFYFTLGNHDIARLPHAPVALLYERIGLARYVEREEPWRDGELVILGFREHRPSELEELEARLRAAEARAAGLEGKKVLVLHQTLREAHQFAGRLSHEALPKNFDYYAMGDLHFRWEKRFPGLGGPVCYPGSLDVISLEPSLEGGTGFEKGYYIVDLSSREASAEWVRLRSTRPQRVLDVRYEQLETLVRSLLEEVGRYAKKPIIRLRVRGKGIRQEALEARLSALREASLYLDVQPLEEGIPERYAAPPDIDAETLRLAAEILGSEQSARLAILDLLPLLAEGKAAEATERLWKMIERGSATC